jgi:hypothetical protein
MLHAVANHQNQHINHKHSKPNYEDYIGHYNEPDAHTVDYIDPEIEEELSRNRLFLKHRVWKNAKKFRKPSSELY